MPRARHVQSSPGMPTKALSKPEVRFESHDHTFCRQYVDALYVTKAAYPPLSWGEVTALLDQSIETARAIWAIFPEATSEQILELVQRMLRPGDNESNDSLGERILAEGARLGLTAALA